MLTRSPARALGAGSANAHSMQLSRQPALLRWSSAARRPASRGARPGPAAARGSAHGASRAVLRPAMNAPGHTARAGHLPVTAGQWPCPRTVLAALLARAGTGRGASTPPPAGTAATSCTPGTLSPMPRGLLPSGQRIGRPRWPPHWPSTASQAARRCRRGAAWRRSGRPRQPWHARRGRRRRVHDPLGDGVRRLRAPHTGRHGDERHADQRQWRAVRTPAV
jgi:hypothetical protein